MDHAVRFLKKFPNRPLLNDVAFEWKLSSPMDIVEVLSPRNRNGHQMCRGLERALLKFAKSSITCTFAISVCADGLSFWLHELGKRFPALLQRGGVISGKCEEGEFRPTLASRYNLIIAYYSVDPVARHDYSVRALVVSLDGKWVASGSGDSTIIIWDTADGTIAWRWVAHNYRPIQWLAFSPDNKYLVSGGQDFQSAVIWSLQVDWGPWRVTTLLGHTGRILTCAWSPDGNTIATGSQDGTARLWDGHTFRQLSLHRLEGHVWSLVFSSNAHWLVCGSSSGECCILNVASGTLHRTFYQYPHGLHRPLSPRVSPIITVFDPGCMHLVVTSSGSPDDIAFMNITSGNALFALSNSGLGFISDISFSPDGKLMLGMPANKTIIYIWDASTGVELFQLKGHPHTVRKACFSPCGRYIASASDEVRLWRTSDGSCVATFSEHRQWAEHIVFSPDGKILSSGAFDGTVVIRRMSDIIPMDDSEQHLHPAVAPCRTFTVKPLLNEFHLPDDHVKRSSDQEVDQEDPRHIPKCEKPIFSQTQRIRGDTVLGSGGPSKLVADVLSPLDRGNKSADVDSWMAAKSATSGARPRPNLVITAPMGVDNPTTRVASLSFATPTGHEVSATRHRLSRKAQEATKNAKTAMTNVEPKAVDSENVEGPSGAPAAKSLLDTKRKVKSEMCRDAPCATIRGGHEHLEEISNGEKNRYVEELIVSVNPRSVPLMRCIDLCCRWTKIPRAITARGRHVVRRAVNCIRKYCEKLKWFSTSASMP